MTTSYSLYFPFNILMMIAQTGIESAASTAVQTTDTASNAIWWLIPIAIACLGLIWYLRRINNVSPPATVRNDTKKRFPAKAKEESTDDTDPSEVNEPNRQVRSSKSSSKKKKKGQSNNQNVGKKQKGPQSDTLVASTPVAGSSKPLPARATSPVPTVEPVGPAMASAPVIPAAPVVAIFEPLRNVAPPRRKASSLNAPSEEAKSKLASEESVIRQASGGKFERIIPSKGIPRSTANRWPAHMTNAVDRVAAVRPAETTLNSRQESTVTIATTPEPQNPAVPAAKGLKGFVSKLKASPGSDAVSAAKLSEAVTSTDE